MQFVVHALLRLVMLVIMITLCGVTSHAQDLARTPVQDARPLLLAALRAPDGNARGVLVGELADAITRRFDATSPIYIDVTTLRRYRQAGCARLSVVFWQDGVHLPDLPIGFNVPNLPNLPTVPDRPELPVLPNLADLRGQPVGRRQTIEFGLNYCLDGLPPRTLR